MPCRSSKTKGPSAYMCIYLFFPFWFLLQCHLNENLKKPNPQIRWRLTTPSCQRRTASGREGNVSHVTSVNRTRPSWPRARSRALCAARPLPSAVRWGMTSWALTLSPSNHELVCFSLLSLFPTLPLSLLRLYYPSWVFFLLFPLFLSLFLLISH